MYERCTGTFHVSLVARFTSLVASLVAADAIGAEAGSTVRVLVAARAQRQVRDAGIVTVTGIGAVIICITTRCTVRRTLYFFRVAVCRRVAATFLGHGLGSAARVVINRLIGADEAFAALVETGTLAVLCIGT